MNKGFKSLPENVQRKIDPEMAKKYMGGGAVMDRPLFRQAGGPAARSPEEMAAMGQQYLMQPPAAAPQGEADAMAMLQQGEAAGMQQGQQIGEMYGEATMASLDAAEDPKSLIDAIRGNAAPLEARYTELAGLVGEEDAQQTPESVLALVQPTIMMTEEGAIDSGIGELMQGLMGEAEMTEGSGMDQGVGELMAMGAGNTPPANFNQGGPVEVRKFAPGGSVISEAQRMAPDFQKYFEGAFDQQARAAALQEQREMSQAQMLFDIAGTALNFAGNTQGRSIAERLANASAQTQLTDKIGTRAAGMLSAKQAQAAEDRQMRMAGLQASLGQAQTNKAAADALELATAKKAAGKEATVNGVPLSIYNELPKNEQRIILGVEDKAPATIKGVPFEFFNKMSEADQSRLILGDPQGVNGVPRDIFDKLGGAAQKAILGTTEGDVKGIPAKVFETLSDEDKKRVLLGDPQGVNGIPMSIYEGLTNEDKKAVLGVAKSVKGIPMSVFEGLTNEDKQRVLLGDPQGVNGVPRDIFETLSQVAKNKVLGTGDDPIKGLPRDIFDTLSKDDQNRFILGDPQGVKGIPRDIFDKLPKDAQALIVDPAAQSALEVQVQKDKEQRAIEQEAIIYGRNRADELADIAAATEREIEAEERRQGRTLSQEERDQITWQARFDITSKNDRDRLVFAQGLQDESQISEEERRAIAEQNRFDRDQAALKAQELRAVANRDTIELREINGELVRVDTLTGETEVIFGDPTVPDPSMAQVTLPNADGVPVTTVIDITSPQGKALIEQVNTANAAAPGSASYQKVPTASTTVRGFLVPGEGVFTSYDGRTYVDEDGNAKPLPGGAFEVSSTIAYEVAKNEKMAAGAQAQLDALDAELLKGMTKIDGSPLSRADMAEVKDAFAAARKGTGFWSKVYAGIDAVAGGLAPEAFGELFKDTTDARQFVKMIRVMGRSALASSPRFAVADLQTTEQLFPNEQALLASPKTEARKLNDIVGYLAEEKTRILEMFAGGTPMDRTMKSTLNQKLFEIDRLESILGPITLLGEASINQEAIDAAKASMRKKKG
jgi:hypothetical protein